MSTVAKAVEDDATAAHPRYGDLRALFINCTLKRSPSCHTPRA